MKAKQTIAGTLAAMMMISAPAAFAQQSDSSVVDRAKEMALEAQSSVLERIDSIAQEYQLELRAELAILETLIKSIEATQYVHDSLKLDQVHMDQNFAFIAIPAALFVGTETVLSGTRLADAVVKTMTPAKARWFEDYANLKAAEKVAKKAYRAAERIHSPEAKDLKIAWVEAQKALSDKLLVKPGMLYRLGRMARAAGRTSVFVGGVSLTAVAFNETLLLAIGKDQMQKNLETFKEKASQIEALLH